VSSDDKGLRHLSEFWENRIAVFPGGCLENLLREINRLRRMRGSCHQQEYECEVGRPFQAVADH
jgi:hypothetical protein